MSDVKPAIPSRQNREVRRTSRTDHAGTPELKGLAAARADSLPSTSSRTFHSPRPPGTHQSASRLSVCRFKCVSNAGAQIVRSYSMHPINEPNASSRTAVPRHYPPKLVNRPMIASSTAMSGANQSPSPPRLPNRSARIITVLLSLLFGLLVPYQFLLPRCGLHTNFRCSRHAPLRRSDQSVRESQKPESESQITSCEDRLCITGRCEEQLARTKVIRAVAVSLAPSPNLSGSPRGHRRSTPVEDISSTKFCSDQNATHPPNVRTIISSWA